MVYKDFNNIAISDYFGISKVADDTLILANHAGKIAAKRVLDMGTGTGFIAIYLSSFGRNVEGVDISLSSIEAAKKNARKNSMNIRFYQSDLFRNVKGTYDLIVFNPPIGTPLQSKFPGFVEKVKSLFPRSTLLFKFFMLFVGGQRKKLLKRFLEEAKNHLARNGKILLFVTDAEKELLKRYTHTITVDHGKNVVVMKS